MQNPKIHLVSYGCERYNKSLARLHHEGTSSTWFDKIFTFTNNDIPESIFVANRSSRGGGYWAWKPYIIKKALEQINTDDILLYLDAGCTINLLGSKRFNHYVKIVNDTKFLGFTSGIEKNFTKQDVFSELNCNHEKYYDTEQIISGIFFIKKCILTSSLIDDWFNITRDVHMIDDSSSVEENSKGFIEHRHDQSCLSLLVKKYSFKSISDETYFDFNSNYDPNYLDNFYNLGG
jgi:hypothetical protein